MANLERLIMPVEIENEDENQKCGNHKFNTYDYVFLDSIKDVNFLKNNERITSATDYALINGVGQYTKKSLMTGKRCTPYWLRSAFNEEKVYCVDEETVWADFGGIDTEHYGVCPVLHLNIEPIISAQKEASSFFKIKDVKDINGNTIYHTAEFGKYPKTKADNSIEMEKLFLEGSADIKPTGKRYTGYFKNDIQYNNGSWINKISYVDNIEYEYLKQKYVRVKINPNIKDERYFEDDSRILTSDNNNFVWIKVEPVEWKIRNWNEMPKSINPMGNGKAEYIDIRTEEAIIGGLPFYPCYENNASLWQNSILRGFLNGINVCNIQMNGNSNYGAPNGGDFSDRSFLKEVFGVSLKQFIPNMHKNKNAQYNPYGFVFDELNNDDLLKLYVKSNASVFLHGPSGVGKSGRVKQMDPTATRITLRPQMNPEEIDGTLDRETGKYIPPLWYTQLTEKCKKEPNRKHVLFIDELTNVKPTVQSLIYSIVLDRAGKDGLWPLPENTVVIAAGNESSNNLAAYPLTNALFRRFSHIYYQVSKADWLDWATGVGKIQKQEHLNSSNEKRARIHPAIIAFIKSRNENILNEDLDEDNPKIVTDPRKWEIASNVLYTTKNPYALQPAIGEELTIELADFVKDIQLSVDDILEGNYNKNEVSKLNISKKYSTVVGLCMADEKSLPKVRNFVLETMGKEMLAIYDSLWIRNDPERANIIEENLSTEENCNDIKF